MSSSSDCESSYEKCSPTDIYRRERRRLSQARHRQNVAESYKALRSLLPVEEKTKVYGLRCNKTILLDKARAYVTHLESALSVLLKTKSLDTNSEHLLCKKNRERKESVYNIEEVRKDFARNFTLHKPIYLYERNRIPLFNDRFDVKEDERLNQVRLQSYKRKRLLHRTILEPSPLPVVKAEICAKEKREINKSQPCADNKKLVIVSEQQCKQECTSPPLHANDDVYGSFTWQPHRVCMINVNMPPDTSNLTSATRVADTVFIITPESSQVESVKSSSTTTKNGETYMHLINTLDRHDSTIGSENGNISCMVESVSHSTDVKSASWQLTPSPSRSIDLGFNSQSQEDDAQDSEDAIPEWKSDSVISSYLFT